MQSRLKLWGGVILLCIAGMSLFLSTSRVVAQETDRPANLFGAIYDSQGTPLAEADVFLLSALESDPLAEAETQADGSFALTAPDVLPDQLSLQIAHTHFETHIIELDEDNVASLRAGEAVVIEDVTLPRHIGLAFWIAAGVFVLMLALIGTGRLHNALAALLGAAMVFAFSYLGRPLTEEFFIFEFERALHYVDWNVIFLVMGMMIVIAVVERTGIFQWLAFMAFRLSGGRVWLLMPILMVIAGVASAFLDNVTTMLLMTPITVQISLALGISPLMLLIPIVMASNVVGISTLIGTPTNILIGSYANISFSAFLINLTPGVVLAMIGLVAYSLFTYRHELRAAGEASPLLMEKLAERARITESKNLKKAGVVGAAMLVLFIIGEQFHLLPAVTAIMGSTALLVWIRPDIEEMIEAVDWTTLVFFMALFMVVGAIEEVGLVSLIADAIGKMVGDNLMAAMMAVTWMSAFFSMAIDNIPFTAAMLPVVGYLSATIPGAGDKVLFFCLSVGAAMGGNGSLIGASANLVTAGIAERAGYPITYMYFLKKGVPALIITVGLASLWLLLKFLVLQ
jgi:Na+/H+ antiporter NhaD/arsenite permease-like protein